ncbi:tRNA (N6-isopentenyl adenosine(37)-C2)-methylthiotransferase MiaB [Treponema parvum]|uniref:tRNA-2-methylthio-N(6)-dimethylallyladenosine synthase n=1 Tax=Treponema parvum TaxID=138851 RepID=A0A975F5G7_9SPIR|nr:tRNA (N6-isopentenyl adenosine(37)-C2)-methylthiotransferase MiaB [Treponema parvum]QTQ14658.1 tRNA (N6-isopentenyl adenosine(37)-C2)-methylthiotransferase MiaB [Treponema parvum]
MTYYFETYGCQMNFAESSAVEQLFLARGWTKADSAQTADCAIINTCSVRATAENRIFGRLGWFQGLKSLRSCEPGAKSKSLEDAARLVKGCPKPITVIVMGCMAERLLHSLKQDYPVIDYVVGTFAKSQFGRIISEIEERDLPTDLDNSAKYKFAPLSYEPGAFTAFVPIMHGCDHFCTFCIVPYVRGREVSRPVEEIIKEIDVLSSYKVKEITLLGQTVNAYRHEGCDFASLLQRIADHLKQTSSSIEWVRFVSSHPKNLSPEILDVIAANPVLCRHIHLAVQHGSSRILQKMNRGHTREEYLELVSLMRKKLPDVSLTTDIMIGFPGEAEEDFEATLSLMREVRYEAAFMYYFNPREGTPAAMFPDQIPLKVKKERLQKVIDLQLEITRKEMELRVGKTVKVLVESVSRDDKNELLGKTEQDERIAFAARQSLIGKFAQVHIDGLSGNTFRGTLLSGGGCAKCSTIESSTT